MSSAAPGCRLWVVSVGSSQQKPPEGSIQKVGVWPEAAIKYMHLFLLLARLSPIIIHLTHLGIGLFYE
jgi:hypothetical protein